MESLVREHGGLSAEHALLVVSLAKSNNLLFGGTADYAVVQEFAESAGYEEKLSLARCLFAVAAADAAISMAEEAESQRVVNQLKVLPADLARLRVEYRRVLPGLSDRRL
jgi:hypothetical protein